MDQQPYNNQPPYGQPAQPQVPPAQPGTYQPPVPPQPGVPPQAGFQPPVPPQPGFQPQTPPPFPPQPGFQPNAFQQPFNSSKANAALALGIVSLVCGAALTFAYSLFFVVGFVCGIVGLVFSIQLRKTGGGGNVNAAFILNIIGVVVNSIWVALCTIGVFALMAGFSYLANW